MPRTKEQNEIIREQKRIQILRASLNLFAIHGYRDVSVDDIMEKVGSAHSLFYHYFTCKEQLFDELVMAAYEKSKEPFRSIDYSKKAIFVLEQVLQKLLSIISTKKGAAEIYLLLTLHIQRKFVPNPDKTNTRFTIWTVVNDLIARGQKEGDFEGSDSYEYAVAILTMLTGLAYKGMFQSKSETLVPRTSTIMKIVLKEGDH